MNAAPRSARRLAVLVATGLLASVPAPQGKAERGELPPQRGPYVRLTDNLRDHTNFNVETVRGLDVASDGSIYALNTHGSLLVWHVDGDREPEGSWGTLNNPVALDVVGSRVLVVGGATRALAIHDRFNGRILGLAPLPAEPGDLVVDEATGIAYVVSQAENVVVALDVNDPAGIRMLERLVVPGEKPRFLSLDVHPVTGARALVVAPMLSGNNTIPRPGRSGVNVTREQATGDILDTSLLESGGLPDEDLIVLPLVGDKALAAPASGRAAGTLMMEHRRNPVTGEYWALSVDLHNDLLGQRSEDELRGVFATNALAIFAPDALVAPRDLPDRIVDLDDADPALPGAQYSTATSLSFPYALAFVPAVHPTLAGWGVVASSTSDRLAFLDPDGNRVFHFNLPEGAIPRDVVIDPPGARLGVYCWGTNEVLVYDLGDLTKPPFALTLGVDPTPAAVRRGRELFYDADPSLDGRVTCATCHAAGGGDGLAWKLSGLDEDPKDVMVTQTLIGIQDTPGYHWRDERSLREFNGAFPGLLGHDAPLDETPGGELDDFVEFVFSLQPHANHRQSPRRVLDDARTPEVWRNGLSGSAVRGQDIFVNGRCGVCHVPPNGTLGLAVPDADLPIPRTRTLGVAQLRQLNHRDQDVLVLSDPLFGGQDLPIPRGGYGLLHSGKVVDVFGFVQAFQNFSPQDHADMTAYIHQYDQGLSPAAHVAIHLRQGTPAAAVDRIRNLLLRQAKRGWIDVVAVGRTPVLGTSQELRWLFRPGLGSAEGDFEPDRAGMPNLTLDQLAQLASVGDADNVFLGLPPGNGPAFAHDRDGDGLRRQHELTFGTDPDLPDTDGDGFPDGYEVQHGADPTVANASVDDALAPVFAAGFPRLDHAAGSYAKIHVECDEPVTVVVDAAVPGGPVHSASVHFPARRHTLVVPRLDPSFPDGLRNDYVATVRATDLSGNVTAAGVAFTTLDTCTDIEALHVNDLAWLSTTPAGSTLDAVAEVLVEHERDAPFQLPAEGRIVVAQLLVRTGPDQPWHIVPDVTSPRLVPDFDVRIVDEDDVVTVETYNSLPGPFLLSTPTDAAGRAQVAFHHPGTPVPPGGQLELRLAIQMIVEPAAGHTLANPVFEHASLEVWSMPATAPRHRALDFAF